MGTRIRMPLSNVYQITMSMLNSLKELKSIKRIRRHGKLIFDWYIFIYVLSIIQSVSKIDARTSLLRKMKSMRSLGNGFASTTGNQMHFNKFQDVPAKYELVNLNVSYSLCPAPVIYLHS